MDLKIIDKIIDLQEMVNDKSDKIPTDLPKGKTLKSKGGPDY